MIKPMKTTKPKITSRYIPRTVSKPIPDKSNEGKKSIPQLHKGASKAKSKPTIVVNQLIHNL